MSEFGNIEKYFRPLTEGNDLLLDDAAVLTIPPGHELVVSSDTLNAGTHFFEAAPPGDIANKALRTNLSDLAAMGALPLAYQLNIAFPHKPDDSWLKSFTMALRECQQEFGIYCSGGDTTSINGSLSISITVMGIVPTGKAVRRGGAKPGDHVILTGPVGDGLIGLRVLQKKVQTKDDAHFVNAYYRPTPRTDIADIIRDYATAAVDISDGLVADLGHICKASNCAAEIQITPGIFSQQGASILPAEELLTGGDDYELVLAVPPKKSAELIEELIAVGLRPIKIGEFTPGKDLSVKDADGRVIPLKNRGWTHF